LPEQKRILTTHRRSGELHGENVTEYGSQVLAAFLGGLLAEVRRR